DLVTLLERSRDLHEHQVRAAGLELERSIRRDIVRLHLPHLHHFAFLDMYVELDLGGRARRSADQPIRRGALVADRQVAAGDRSTRRSRARPRLVDLDLRLCRSRRKQQRESENPHCAFLLVSSSCSLRQKILPVAVFGSASTNSTTRGY